MNVPSLFNTWYSDVTGTGTVAIQHGGVVARCVADSSSAALVRRWFFSKPGDFVEISVWARCVNTGDTTGGQFRLDSISGTGHTVIKQLDLPTRNWRKYTISFQRNMLGDSYGNVLSFAAGFNTVKSGMIDIREPELKVNGQRIVDNLTVIAGTVVFDSTGTPSIRQSSPNVHIGSATWDSAYNRVIVTPATPIQYRARAGLVDNLRDIYPAASVSVGANEPRTVTRNPISIYHTMNYDVGTLSFYFYDSAALPVTDKGKLKDFVISFRVTA